MVRRLSSTWVNPSALIRLPFVSRRTRFDVHRCHQVPEFGAEQPVCQSTDPTKTKQGKFAENTRNAIISAQATIFTLPTRLWFRRRVFKALQTLQLPLRQNGDCPAKHCEVHTSVHLFVSQACSMFHKETPVGWRETRFAVRSLLHSISSDDKSPLTAAHRFS